MKKVEFLTGLSEEARKEKKEVLSQTISPINLSEVRSVADLVEGMAGMSIQARNIGACAEVLRSMLTDPDRPTIFLGLAGPLIAAGLRNVIRDLVSHGIVDVVVSTGAILYQDIYQARGYKHYKGTPNADDVKLRDLWIDRIYDTYVDEEKFWETDLWCGLVADEMGGGNHSSRQYLEYLAGYLQDEKSIVRECKRLGVPIFCPAINDSSIGIGLTEHYHRHKKDGSPLIAINSIQDNYEITQIVAKSKKTAAIYIAGGVPKNYINDSIVMGYIFNVHRGHSYAIQVTTDVPHWGGLSGSTLKEAQSWGKVGKTASTAMAFVEPSVSLPLLAAYALERRLYEGRQKIAFEWEGDILKSLKYEKRG